MYIISEFYVIFDFYHFSNNISINSIIKIDFFVDLENENVFENAQEH